MRQYLFGRLKSFIPAIQGIFQLVKYEKNAAIHTVATILVVVFSFVFQINIYEWLFVLLAISLVWITELINTSIEKITDLIQPNLHPTAKIIKDFSAGAVLIAAIFSIVVAILIFIPKIIN